MIRLSALNDDSSDESEPERTQESIKQAQEAEALELYNKALGYQHSEDYTKAEETYNLLLSSALVKEAPAPEQDEGLHHPGQVLKYSAYKNLAVLAETKEEYEKATDAYLEAVLLDDSDVTVWYHVGKVSIKCCNLGLARHAFEEGLRCNPKHWPCLDELCTVLYAIGDYSTCLVMISGALERDENYLKGLALRDKMFKEEPYLKRDYKHLRTLFVSFIDEDEAAEASKYVKEALELREERLKLIEADKADPPPVNPVKPMTSYTWASLGECFVVLYDHLTSPDNPQSLGRTVNLEDYYKAIVTPDISMPHKASLAKASDNLASSSFSTEGFGVYKSAGSSDNDEKIKKATKRKKPPTNGLENDFLPKRRSARVRTSKKKEEDINYKDLIQSFMPFPLRTSILAEDESSQDSLNDSQLNVQRGNQPILQDGKTQDKLSFGQASEYEDVISGEAETLDVLTFVKEHMSNGGIIDLMIKFGICLSAQRNKKWPPALADVFLKVYSRLRKHVILPSEFVRDQDEVYKAELAKLILVATELTLDKLLTAKSKSSSSLSPASSPRGGQTGVSPIHVGPGISSKFLATDVEYLHCIALDRSVHGDSWLEMAIRVNWAKARYLMLQGQMEIAMLYLDRCTKLLAVEVSPLAEPITVKLVNCKIDNNITLEHVHKKLESLQRCQSLEEVHRLYELGHYEDVVQLLIPTLHQPQPKTKTGELGMSIPERPAQLLLLQDSLIKLKDFKKCLECSEVALNEAVSQMSPCEAWSTTLSRLFQCMNTCIDETKTILDGFSIVKLQSLTLNIIKVIEASIYSSDVSMEPPLATAFPWVLLCKFIKNKENDYEMEVDTTPKPSTPLPPSQDSPVPGMAGTSDIIAEAVSLSNDAPTLSMSLRFLRTAHDHLGRRGWCCNNDGIFLLLCVELLTEELAKPNMSSREDVVRDLEQCFLCLYGHPSKKAKLRGLQEHNSCQIPLTWHNSAVVFNYFKPPELPTFDSKTNTISTEVQNLMRRITLVVPQHELEAICFDNVQAFIEGVSDDVPKLPESLASIKRPVVSELFYLLADFYFKNKEFSKALKFYTHDICVQPNRSDSWAAMALIRKSRLESKLNACEPKSEGPIQKHAIAALRCFKRAMETDSTNSSILEEYGSLCYFLHSHASRQLKQFDQEEEVSLDTRSSLSQRKQEMLVLSEQIFTTALGMDDSEVWLHHYMLGKIAEKLKKSPEVYLEHYERSAKYLDEDIPSYPRKIPFYSPPDHVLEALEVYYRVHVSVLKLILNEFPDVDKELLEKHLQRAAKGPFFQPEYDVDGGHGIAFRSESTTSEISAIEAEKQAAEPSSGILSPTKIPLINESNTSEALQVSSDDQENIVAEKANLGGEDVAMETTPKDDETVVSGVPSQRHVQKNKELSEVIRNVTSLEQMLKDEKTNEMPQEQSVGNEKIKEEKIVDEKEDIAQTSTADPTNDSSKNKTEETLLEDKVVVTINNKVCVEASKNAEKTETKGDDSETTGTSKLFEKRKTEKEEKTVDVEHDIMEFTDDKEESLMIKDSDRETEDKENASFDVLKQQSEKDDTVMASVKDSKNILKEERNDSEVLDLQGPSETRDTSKAMPITTTEISTTTQDKVQPQNENPVCAETSNVSTKPDLEVTLSKDSLEISKGYPENQGLEKAISKNASEIPIETLETPAVKKTDSLETFEKRPEILDLGNVMQKSTADTSKDLNEQSEKLEAATVGPMEVSEGQTEKETFEKVIPMDTTETSETKSGQDAEMEISTDAMKSFEKESTERSETENLQPGGQLETSKDQPEKQDVEKVLPMDTTETEKLQEQNIEKEVLMKTTDTSEKANEKSIDETATFDRIDSNSENKASAQKSDPEESSKENPTSPESIVGQHMENDTKEKTMDQPLKSDSTLTSPTEQLDSTSSMTKDRKPLTEAQKAVQRELIDVCIHGLEHCLLRFPQHHKSRYRLAYVYSVSPYHKDLQLSRALLLGENTGKTKLQRNPHQGLFNEKSKTNMFSAFWRIPEEDIDRPGSFCTHTHKSVDLLLQVLREVSEWDTLINVFNLLHRTPEPGKKYLRDNERNFLARKACDFSVEIMTKRVESQDTRVEPAVLCALVYDTYECWKVGQKYEGTAKITENLVIKAFEMYRAKVPDSPDAQSSGESQPSVLERALRFCQQSSKPQTSSTSTAPQTPADSSIDSQADIGFGSDETVMAEIPHDVRKRPQSVDQSDGCSLPKELKDCNEISVEMVKEKEADSEAVSENVSSESVTDSLNKTSLTANSSELKIQASGEEQKDSVGISQSTDVAQTCKAAPSTGEKSKSPQNIRVLLECSKSYLKASASVTTMNAKPSDDLPKPLNQSEVSLKPAVKISSSVEMITGARVETSLKTGQTGNSEQSPLLFGDFSKTEDSPSLAEDLMKTEQSPSLVGGLSKTEESPSLVGVVSKTEDLTINTLSLNENPSGTEPVSVDEEQQ